MKNIKLSYNKDALVFDYGMTEECFYLEELECVFRRENDIFFISEDQGETMLMPTTTTSVVKGYFKDLCKALDGSGKFVMCGEDTVLNTEKLLDYSVANKQKILTLCFESSNVTCKFDSIEELKQAEDLIYSCINSNQNEQ